MKNRFLALRLGVMFAVVVGLFAGIVAVAFFNIKNNTAELLTILLPLGLVIAIFISWIYIIFLIRTRRMEIRKSFDTYVEELMATSGVGVIMFDDTGEVYWTSKFIESRLEKTLIGSKIHTISDEFKSEFLAGKKLFRFTLDGIVFEARVHSDSQTIVFKDVTNEATLLRQYIDEKHVLAEIEIDNYQQFQNSLPEEELFRVQSFVIKVLDDLVAAHGITYRQYVNGKYLLIANHSVLTKMIADNFSFLETVRSQKVSDGTKLTISAGFGVGASSQKELIDLAKDGLTQAQARGGDQIAVMEYNKKPRYFGSKVEAAKTTSRVKIKQVTEIIENRLSERKIKNVIIYGHVFADLDAVGAAMGMYDIAKSFEKEVYIQNSSFDATTTKALAALPKDEIQMFIRSSKAQRITTKESTMVIIVDTAELERIENREALDGVNANNIFILDHHRVSKLPKAIPTQNMYIDTSASSASEIVCEVFQFTEKAIKPSKITAQMLLNGIYLDTKSFTKAISSRTFAAASWLESHGAQATLSVDILKLPSEYAPLIRTILSGVREVRPGYFLASYEGEVPSDVVSIIADEILRTQDRKAAFVVAKVPGDNKYKMSARGIDTNVQIIAEAVGGGGHFGAAAAVSDEPLSIFVDNIIQAIISSKGDMPALRREQTVVFKGKL